MKGGLCYHKTDLSKFGAETIFVTTVFDQDRPVVYVL